MTWNGIIDGVTDPLAIKGVSVTSIEKVMGIGSSTPPIIEGGMWNWGLNTSGQLGLGDIINRSSPVQVGSLTTWNPNSIGIKTDNTLFTWGYNDYGELGLGDRVNRSSPVQVGSSTDWAYKNDSMALKTDGTLWAIGGYNTYGGFGIGNSAYISSPVQVGSLTDWVSVHYNYSSTKAIKNNGTLWVCGRNDYGQLGLGDRTHISSPVQVGSLTDWASTSGAESHIMAVKTDGTLWALGGKNHYRQLGLEDLIDRSSPVQVGSLTDWSSVSCGFGMTMALKTDGTLWAIGGYNADGQLGTGDQLYVSSPIQVGSLTNWASVSCGKKFTIALKTGGTIWSWGSNNYGQLGHGDTANLSSPVQVGSLTIWAGVEGRYDSSFAIKE